MGDLENRDYVFLIISLKKELIMTYSIAKGIPISEITDSGLIDSLVKIKYEIPNAHLELFDNYRCV